eukprot:3294335-Rhodomonas_salina.1
MDFAPLAITSEPTEQCALRPRRGWRSAGSGRLLKGSERKSCCNGPTPARSPSRRGNNAAQRIVMATGHLYVVSAASTGSVNIALRSD